MWRPPRGCWCPSWGPLYNLDNEQISSKFESYKPFSYRIFFRFSFETWCVEALWRSFLMWSFIIFSLIVKNFSPILASEIISLRNNQINIYNKLHINNTNLYLKNHFRSAYTCRLNKQRRERNCKIASGQAIFDRNNFINLIFTALACVSKTKTLN